MNTGLSAGAPSCSTSVSCWPGSSTGTPPRADNSAGGEPVGVSVNIVGGAGLRARQYGPMAATEGRPTGLPTFLTPTRPWSDYTQLGWKCWNGVVCC